MQPNPCRYCKRDMNNNPFHDTESCMLNRIAELEEEVKKWKLSVCHWQDVNGELEEQLKVRGERMEIFIQHIAKDDLEWIRESYPDVMDWFTDEGKCKDDL